MSHYSYESLRRLSNVVSTSTTKETLNMVGATNEKYKLEFSDPLLAHYTFDDASKPALNSVTGVEDGVATGTTTVDGIAGEATTLFQLGENCEDISLYKNVKTVISGTPIFNSNGRIDFDGASRITYSYDSSIMEGTGDFTIKFRMSLGQVGIAGAVGNQSVIGSMHTLSAKNGWYLETFNTTNAFRINIPNTTGSAWLYSVAFGKPTLIGANEEHSYVLMRKSGIFYIAIDGVIMLELAVPSKIYSEIPNILNISDRRTSYGFLSTGSYIKDLQVLNYAEYENISRTQLLLNSAETNNSSDMTGLDVSTFKNTFTNTSVTHSTSRLLGGASSSLYFNGSSRLLWNTNVPPLGNSEFELSAWVYPTVAATGYIFADWASADYDFCLYLSSSSGFKVTLNNDAPILTFGTDTATVLNKWSHLKVSRVGDTIYTFLNGVMVESATYTGSLDLTEVAIGSNSTGVTQALTGYIQYLKLDIGKGYSNDFELHTNIPDIIKDFTPPNTLPIPSGGEYGTACRITSSSSVRYSSNIFNGPSYGSIAFWVKPESLVGSPMLVARRDATHAAIQMQIKDTGEVRILVNNGTTWGINLSTPVSLITINQWWHIGVTIDTSINECKIYINGELKATQVYSGTLTTQPIDMTFGFFDLDASSKLTGSIDDFRFYNKALTAEEIQQLYRPGIKALVKDPIVHYDFTDAVEDIVSLPTVDIDTTILNDGTDYLAIGPAFDRIDLVTPATDPTQALGRDNITNNALSFNGVDQFISSSSQGLPYGNSSRTISFWVKLNAIGQSSTHLIGYGSWATTAQGFTVGIDNANKLALSCYLRNYTVTAAGTLDDLNWHHIVVTWNGSNASLYNNGVLSVSSLTSGTAGAINTVEALPLRIGSHFGTAGFYSNSKIQDIKIYNKALTAEEIGFLYSEDIAKKEGLFLEDKVGSSDGKVVGVIPAFYPHTDYADGDYYDITGIPINQTQDNTWCVEVNFNNLSASRLLSIAQTIPEYRGLFLEVISTGNLQFAGYGGGTVYLGARAVPSVTIGAWSKIVGVYNSVSNTFSLYVNGSLIASNNLSQGTWGGVVASSSPFSIGRRQDATAEMDASLRNVELYSGVATNPEEWVPGDLTSLQGVTNILALPNGSPE